MTRRYRACLIDIDNTLYPYEVAHRAGLASSLGILATRSGVARTALETGYRNARRAVKSELGETGSSHNRLLYFQRCCELLGVYDLSLPYDCYAGYWKAYFGHMVLRPGVTAFLEALAGMEACFVTDLTADVQYRKIKILGLDRYVRKIVTSEEAGRDKPHPRIFELALQKVGVPPHEACMIGDSFAKDMLGAVGLGIDGFWLKGDEPEQRHPDVRSFGSFEALAEVMGC